MLCYQRLLSIRCCINHKSNPVTVCQGEMGLRYLLFFNTRSPISFVSWTNYQLNAQRRLGANRARQTKLCDANC